jgi:hypothetical protein
MSAKTIFSSADLAAISARLARYSASSASTNSAYLPRSPIVARLMREKGVSREKMNEAYRIAQMTVRSGK